MSVKTICETIRQFSDGQMQHLCRRSRFEDLLVLMFQDSQLKEMIFRNVKMTTRLWLQSELETMNAPEMERLTQVETNMTIVLAKLISEPPEEFE